MSRDKYHIKVKVQDPRGVQGVIAIVANDDSSRVGVIYNPKVHTAKWVAEHKATHTFYKVERGFLRGERHVSIV